MIPLLLIGAPYSCNQVAPAMHESRAEGDGSVSQAGGQRRWRRWVAGATAPNIFIGGREESGMGTLMISAAASERHARASASKSGAIAAALALPQRLSPTGKTCPPNSKSVAGAWRSSGDLLIGVHSTPARSLL